MGAGPGRKVCACPDPFRLGGARVQNRVPAATELGGPEWVRPGRAPCCSSVNPLGTPPGRAAARFGERMAPGARHGNLALSNGLVSGMITFISIFIIIAQGNNSSGAEDSLRCLPILKPY